MIEHAWTGRFKRTLDICRPEARVVCVPKHLCTVLPALESFARNRLARIPQNRFLWTAWTFPVIL